MLALSLVILRFAYSEAFSLRAGTQSIDTHGSTPVSGPIHDVFLFAGESNCLGLGFQKDLPAEYAEIPKSLQVWKADQWNNDWDGTSSPGQFGPEVTFSHYLKTTYEWRGESFGMVKVSKNMTSLYNDWAQSNYKELVGTDKLEELRKSAKRWDPQSDNTDFEPWLFADLIDSTKKALQSDACAGECRVEALIWVQGESDAMNAEYADVYEASLANMVGILREELQSPYMKVVVGEVTPDLSLPAAATVAQAQEAFVLKEGPGLASFARAAGVEANSFSKLSFDTVGQDLGSSLGYAYFDIGEEDD